MNIPGNVIVVTFNFRLGILGEYIAAVKSW